MKSSIDIADLVQINKLLSNYINRLVSSKTRYDYFVIVLNSKAEEINNNNKELIGLLKGFELTDRNAVRPLLKAFENKISLKYLNENNPQALEFEYWIGNAVEAYKSALNATFLTNSTFRFILMDQKSFLQNFLLDLIKNRELNPEVNQATLSVYM